MNKIKKDELKVGKNKLRKITKDGPFAGKNKTFLDKDGKEISSLQYHLMKQQTPQKVEEDNVNILDEDEV